MNAGAASKEGVASGTLYNGLARVAFVLSSYVVHVAMAYVLPPNQYGTFGVILSITTLFRVVMSAGIPQSASQFIAADESRAVAIWRTAAKLQMIGAFAVLLVFLGGAKLWAALLKDPNLTGYIALSSLMIPLMAWYSINLGYFNGRLQFKRQAIWATLYAVARPALALPLAALGFGLTGAVSGLVAAVALVAVISHVAIPGDSVHEPFPWRRLLAFSWPVVLTSIATSLLLNLDILILQRFFPNSEIIGFYNGAMNLGKGPYWILTAFAMTGLPAAARALAQGGREAGRLVVQRAVSYLLLVSIPGAALVAVTSRQLMRLAYRSSFVVASVPLSFLVVSMCGLSLLLLLHACITAAGRPRAALAVVAVCIPGQLVLAAWLVPRYGMVGTAAANLATVVMGIVLAGGVAHRAYGPFVDFRRVGKSLLATLPVAVALRYFDSYPLAALPVVYIVALGLHAILLVVIGGITADELAALRRFASRRTRAASSSSGTGASS